MKENKPCIKCGSKIINRLPNSNYCKDCADIHQTTKISLGNSLYRLRKKYPNLKINYKLNLIITKNDPGY